MEPPQKRARISQFGAASAQADSRIFQVGNMRGENIYISCQDSRSAEPGAAQRFSNLHLQRVANYVERASLQSKLRAHFTSHEGTRNTVVVVSGFGGAGKTQLSLWYAQEYQHEYAGVFWLRVDGQLSVEREITAIYQWMYPSREDNLTFRDMIVRINSWFQGRKDNHLWLIDNADSVEDPNSPDFVDLSQLIPQASCVHVIVTTRSRTLHGITSREPIEVDQMSKDQALEVFWRFSKIDRDKVATLQQQHAISIIENASHIPLAISLAGATIAESPRMKQDLQLYIDTYQQNFKKLLSRQPEKLVLQYSESILASWETSYSHLSAKSQLAAHLLAFLALLDPRDVFISLFEIALSRNEAGEDDDQEAVWQQTLVPEGNSFDIDELEAALAVLRSFSMIQYEPGPDSYSMHSLVQAWSLERLDEESRAGIALNVCGFLVRVAEKVVKNFETEGRIAKHMVHSFRSISGSVASSPAMSTRLIAFLNLWDRFATLLINLALFDDFAKMSRTELALCNQFLGEDDKYTMWAEYNLASALFSLRHLDESISIAGKLKEKRTRILGEDHPDTVNITTSLAGSLLEQGQYEEGIAMLQKVLDCWKETPEDNYPDILLAKTHLSAAYRDQGKHEECLPLKRAILSETAQLYGEDNPRTIVALHNLANTLEDCGDIGEAFSMRNEVVQQRKLLLGANHPDTLLSMHNLSTFLMRRRRFEEAVSILSDVLTRRGSTIGESHPDTIETMSLYSETLKNLGKLDDAASVGRNLLQKRISALGENHKDTLTTMDSLAVILRDDGKYQEANNIQREVLSRSRSTLGEEHIDTLYRSSKLARTIGLHGNLDEAESIQMAALKELWISFGETHTYTRFAANNLGRILILQKKFDEAIAVFEDLIEKIKGAVEENDSDMVDARQGLSKAQEYHALALGNPEAEIDIPRHIMEEY